MNLETLFHKIVLIFNVVSSLQFEKDFKIYSKDHKFSIYVEHNYSELDIFINYMSIEYENVIIIEMSALHDVDEFYYSNLIAYRDNDFLTHDYSLTEQEFFENFKNIIKEEYNDFFNFYYNEILNLLDNFLLEIL